jgi:sortase A
MQNYVRYETGRLDTTTPTSSRFAFDVHRTERVLWAIGAALLAYCAFVLGTGLYEQARGERELAFSSRADERSSGGLTEGRVIGRIRMPRLDLSAVIFEGTSESVLRKGVGRLPGSALPADSGNVVLAAHRDTFFRSLKDVRKDDALILETPAGTFHYVVRTTKVVRPDAVEVLKPTSAPTVTLITCYPFGYLGRAPDRFIVRAERRPEVGI